MTRYRGRLAPSPTGYLHLGHAATFAVAQERCRSRAGTLILRIDDLDRERCKSEYRAALVEDMRWYGLNWQEGPFWQNERVDLYREAWKRLAAEGWIYPCTCTRRDVEAAIAAPHEGEPIYPGTCRPAERAPSDVEAMPAVNWRLRAEAREEVTFVDGRAGAQTFRAGRDFGDFLAWRKDGLPAYQLATVVDDAALGITEVVRGEDLLASTAQQLLIYRALGLQPPKYYHCELVKDAAGQRLAKRAGSHSLHALREAGVDPRTLWPVATARAAL